MAISDNELNSLKNQWNNLSYADQQAKLSSNSKLQWALNSLWLSVKSAPTNTTPISTKQSGSNSNSSVNWTQWTNTTPSTTNTQNWNNGNGTNWGFSTNSSTTNNAGNNTAWYNQVKPEEVNNRTRATNSTVDNLWYQWDKLTYEQQQEKFNQTPALRTAVEKLWLKIKWPNDVTPTTTRTTNTGTTNTGTTWTTGNTGDIWKTENTFVPWSEWDYQDNSQARMDQIANNLSRYRITNPELFENRDDFYNFFIKDKGRSQDQIDYLWSYYDNVQKYWKYDTLTPNEIWAGLVDWTIPQDYLNWLKATDPAKYSWVGEAMKDKQDEIMNESYLNTIMEEAGLGNQTGNEYSDMTKWAMKNWLFVDKNGDWTDDWLYPEASEEEKKLWKADSEYEAEKLKLTNAMKDLQSDLTDQYPDADLSTIMLLTADRWQKIQKALDTIAVSQTRTQWEIKYMQNERDMQSKARQNTISNLQKAYGMYYDYTPEWMSELAQAQYAATNVTLDQADNGTDTQKQMALQNVLDWYYSKYWDIIERSEQQVINDVMALAKSKGMSLSDALEENFLQYLRAKPWYKQLSTVTSNPDVFKIWENSYWYWDADWNLIPIGWVTWTWVGTMRTERNNNPTAMTTDVAKSLWGIEWEDYVQWDSWTNDKWQTFYTAKLLGDPIETTIKLLDRAASTWRWAFYTSWGKQRWSHTAMSDADWLKLTPEEKQWVVLKMLQREWWDINKMAWYNWAGSNSWYDSDLVELFKLPINKLTKDLWNRINKMWYDEKTYLSMRNNYLTNLAKEPDETTVDILDKLWYLMVNYPWRTELMAAAWTQYLPTEYWADMWTYMQYYDFIRQNLTMDNLTKLKANGATFGSLTEWEWPRIENSAKALWTKMKESDFKWELLNIYNTYAKKAGMWTLTMDDIKNMYGWSNTTTTTQTQTLNAPWYVWEKVADPTVEDWSSIIASYRGTQK